MKTFATTPKAEEMRAYRRRLAAEGQQEIIAALPRDAIAFLDQFKQSQGLRNRSQAMLQLIEQGRHTAQQ